MDAYLLFFVSLLLLLTVGRVFQAISLPVGVLGTEVLLIFLPAVVYVRVKRLPIAEGLRWRPIPAATALRCVVLGVFGFGAAAAVSLTTTGIAEAALGPPPSMDFLLPRTPGELGMFLILGGALGGFCEETLFRGAIQGTLERKGIWKGIAISGLLFAAFHLDPWRFLGTAALGLFFGVVTVRTNTTLAPAICHACNNALGMVVITIFGKWIERQGAAVLWCVAAPSALLFVVALLEFLHHTRNNERVPSPLVTASPQLSRRSAAVLASVVAAFAVSAFVSVHVFLGAYRMAGDRLAPEINRGDYVIVVKTAHINVGIQPGDVIAFKRNDTTFLRRVARVDHDGVWVVQEPSADGESHDWVARADITGKVIHTLRPGWK